jgi:asparagine synthase (glutamine-hydrolysing)
MLSGIEEPFDGEFVILKAIFLAAQNLGTRVVLDGGAGDVVLGEGTYITRLIRQGRVGLAMREIAAQHKFWQCGSTASSLLHFGRSALAPEAIKKWLRGPRVRLAVKKDVRSSLISEEFACRVDIGHRFEKMRQTFGSVSIPDYAAECSNAIRPNLTAGRERYARIAASMGVEARDPFLDKRVVDFCSRLPGRFRLKDGWPKMILRELMADKLPDEVLWCRGKPHLGWFFNATVTGAALRRGDLDVASLGEALKGYVDPAALTRAWQRFDEVGDTEQIDSAYHLSAWLRGSTNRPVVPD